MDFFIDLATNLHRLAPALLTPARSESVVRIGLTDRPPGLALVLRTDSKRNKGQKGKREKILTRHFCFLDSPCLV